MNALDSEQVDQIEFISKVISLVDKPPFYLSRYKDLKIADFTEDVTTINAADLLGGAEANNNVPQAQQQAQNEAMIN